MAFQTPARVWVRAMLLGAIIAGVAGTVPASAQLLWNVEQITSTVSPQPNQPTVSPPALSADGSALAFFSIGDLGGTNPLASPELFLFRRDTGTFDKLTSYDRPGGLLPSHDMRRLSRDGGMVLFTEEDLNGPHWVIENTTTGVRLKEGPDYGVFLNPSATFVLFFSNDDLVGGNPDGSWELYRYDIANDTFSQLTHDIVLLRMEAVASDDGNSVVIASPDDLVPGSNGDGSVELFSLDPATGAWTQLTSTPQGSDFWDLSMDAAGSMVAFVSSFDFTGGSSTGTSEVFLLRVATGSILQLTHDDQIPVTIAASISGNGNVVAIATSRNLTGDNPDHSGALFVYDVRTGNLQQVSDASLGSVVTEEPPAVDATGNAVAVVAGGDFTGGNPDGNTEVFLFTRPGARKAAIPAGSPLLRLLLIVLIGTWGAYAVGRRTVA